MDFFDLVLYLVLLGVTLVGYYVKRRQTTEQQRELGQLPEFGVHEESQEVNGPPNFCEAFWDDGVPTEPVSASQRVSTQEALFAREKPVYGSAYRSLARPQEAPANWETQKGMAKKTAFRAQFKNHKGIQQAVVNMVVLGPCRTDDPYR
jgi:hypothetical protein